jgi:hypothetical protein
MPFTSDIQPDSLLLLDSAAVCHAPDPVEPLSGYTSTVPGVKGIIRQTTPADNPWISGLLLICFLLVTVGYSSANKFMHYLLSELFDYKARSFAPKATLGVFRLKLALLLMTFVVEGLALFMVYTKLQPHADVGGLHALTLVGVFAAGFMTLYVLNSIVARLLVYTFSSTRNIAPVIGALSSSTVLMGLLLFIPVLVFVYYTFPLQTFIFILFSLYAISRILFICRGVNVFFGNIYSSIYVILYLCAIELTPLLFVYKGLCLLFSLDLKLD